MSRKALLLHGTLVSDQQGFQLELLSKPSYVKQDLISE